MKKIIAVLFASLMVLLMLAGCEKVADSKIEVTDRVTVRLGGLTGPTTMGMVKLLEDSENALTANQYDFTLASAADSLSPMLITGELDIAAIPANLAAVLYNKTGGNLEVLAVNTLGVLYMVEVGDENITSVSDLKGKTIYATGMGASPEYTLRCILSGNGINPDTDVAIEWKSEPAEIVAQLSANGSGIAMLPQPYVTVAQGKIGGLHTVLDMTEEWNKLDIQGQCITGVVVAQKAFVKEHPEQVADFLSEYSESINYVNANASQAAGLIEKFGIVPAAVAEKAIPGCNITYIAGDDMRSALEGYLNVLYSQNPASVGGAMPADDFYYIG